MFEDNYFLIALVVFFTGFFFVFNDTFKLFESNRSEIDKLSEQFVATSLIALAALIWPILFLVALIIAICYPLMKLCERAPNPIDFLKRIKIEKAEQNNKD